VAGLQIDPLSPGYKHIIIKPLVTDKLDYAEARHQSLYGEVLSRWDRKGARMVLKVQVPANTTASVYIHAKAGYLLESGRPIDNHSSVSIVETNNENIQLSIGSGTYIFEYEN
jgi:alpha-L-rhamnosidase